MYILLVLLIILSLLAYFNGLVRCADWFTNTIQLPLINKLNNLFSIQSDIILSDNGNNYNESDDSPYESDHDADIDDDITDTQDNDQPVNKTDVQCNDNQPADKTSVQNNEQELSDYKDEREILTMDENLD